jgi:hypothetical protein
MDGSSLGRSALTSLGHPLLANVSSSLADETIRELFSRHLTERCRTDCDGRRASGTAACAGARALGRSISSSFALLSRRGRE